MLEDIFYRLVEVSALSSILIIVLLLLKKIFEKQLSARWHYLLWMLLIIRLALPVNFYYQFQFIKVPKINAPIISSISKNTVVNINTNTKISENPPTKTASIDSPMSSNKFVSEVTHEKAYETPINIKTILPILWILVLLSGLFLILAANLHLILKIKRAKPSNSPFIDVIFRESCKELNIKKHIQIIESDFVKSPSLYGILHPVILLPDGAGNNLSATELKHVFTHEICHYKQKDILINHLTVLLQLAYWFNPLVVYALQKSKQDRELSCDALALSYIGYAENITYGRTVIKLLELFSADNRLIMNTGMFTKPQALKRRIKMIKNSKNNSKKLSLLIAALVVIVSITSFIIPKSAETALAKSSLLKVTSTSNQLYSIGAKDKVTLTLNKSMQQYCQQALDKALKTYKAKEGTVIIMETSSGKLLALASQNSAKKINNASIFESVYGQNSLLNSSSPAISKLQTAGSLFKPLTTAAILKYNKGAVKNSYTCDNDKNDPIKCWKTSGHGKLDFETGFIDSCNIVFSEASAKIKADDLKKIVTDFGLTGTTCTGLKKEVVNAFPPAFAGKIEKAAGSIGMNIEANPLQLLNAINAIANSGKMMRPYLIEKISYASGKEDYKNLPICLRSVLDTATATIIKNLMAENVAHGSASTSKISNLEIAGISATVPKLVNNLYKNGKYIASFCGFAPAKNPKITAIVVIDEPDSSNFLSATTAAPLFKNIVQNCINYVE